MKNSIDKLFYKMKSLKSLLIKHQKVLHLTSRLQSTYAVSDVFNKKLRIKFLDKSSMADDAHVYDYIKDHVARDVCDRVDDLKLDNDKKLNIYNMGSCSGLVTKHINHSKVQSLTQGDISTESLKRCRRLDSMLDLKFPINYMECDEESVNLEQNSMDLVISCMNLHWVNNLVACFNNVHKILKRDSPFIGALLGGDTLYELRSSLQLAEMERLSGLSCHMAPKTTGQDMARLLQGSGFQLITVDISELKICYPSMFELMFDLKGMGENNASIIGSRHMHRDVIKAGAAIYQQLYGTDDPSQGIPATFQVIHFIGWKEPRKATPLKDANQTN